MTALGRRRGADRGDNTIDSRDQWKPREESGMDARRLVIVGRFGRRWLWCALGAMLALGPGVASAQSQLDACTQTSFGVVIVAVPNCQSQLQAPISYSAWQTQGWAYYCTGDHPYFYHSNGSWVVDNSNDC